jgi:hypothetical protein
MMDGLNSTGEEKEEEEGGLVVKSVVGDSRVT